MFFCHLSLLSAESEGGQLGRQLMEMKTIVSSSLDVLESENTTVTSNWLSNDLLSVLKTILNFILRIYFILVVFIIIMLTLCSSVSYVSNNIFWYSSRIIGNIYFMIIMRTYNLLIWLYWILYLYYATMRAILIILGDLILSKQESKDHANVTFFYFRQAFTRHMEVIAMFTYWRCSCI